MRVAPLLALFYAVFIFPPEFSITISGLWLPAYRLVVIASMVIVILRLLEQGAQRLSFTDLLITMAGLWILVSFMSIYGVAQGIVRGAGVVFDIYGSYLLARTSVRSFQDFRLFLLLVLPAVGFAGLIMALESLLGSLFYRPTFGSIFGGLSAYSGGDASGQIHFRPEVRLGLLRAYGPFSHPILGGLMLGVFLPLFYFSAIRSWPRLVGLGAGFAGVFSLSSAALMGMLLFGIGISLDFIKRRIIPTVSWWIMIFFIGLAAFAIHLASQNGLVSVLARYTLVPHTASYRLAIWEHGTESVRQNPWFGIGYEQWDRLWWMGESVDAHFLLLAMRHGIIVPILIIVASIYAMARLGMLSSRLPAYDRRLVIGANLALGIMLIAGQTVAFFGASNLIFMSLIAIVVSLLSDASQPMQVRAWRARPAKAPSAPAIEGQDRN